MESFLLIRTSDSWFQNQLHQLGLKIMDEFPVGKEKDFAIQTIAECMATAGSDTTWATLTICKEKLKACQFTLSQKHSDQATKIFGYIGEILLTKTEVIRA